MDRRVPPGGGESVTVGRAPTNQIVIKDERCSRNHAEIFQSQGQWTLRDLDSRNGTLVGGKRIQTRLRAAAGRRRPHRPLAAGVRPRPVAGVSRFAHAAAHGASRRRRRREPRHDRRVRRPRACSKAHEPTTITHRRGQTRFLAEPPEDEDVDVALPKVGRAAAKLCRLAFELAKATDVVSLANVALDGLFEGTHVDAGAVLLRPARTGEQATARRPRSRRLAHRFAASLPPRLAVSGRRPCCATARPCWPAT